MQADKVGSRRVDAPTSFDCDALRREFQAYRGSLAGAPVGLQFVDDLLALAECADIGSLKRRSVDEHVLAAASRLNEAATALVIVPFHCALIHKICTGCTFGQARDSAARPVHSIFWGS